MGHGRTHANPVWRLCEEAAASPAKIQPNVALRHHISALLPGGDHKTCGRPVPCGCHRMWPMMVNPCARHSWSPIHAAAAASPFTLGGTTRTVMDTGSGLSSRIRR